MGTTARALLLACACCSLLAAPAAAKPLRLDELSKATLDRRADHDLKLLKSYTLGISRLQRALRKHSDLFQRDRDVKLSPDERELALALFEQVFSYTVALDRLAAFHGDFWRLGAVRNARRHARHFAIGFSAYCLRLSLGLGFVDRTIGRPQFEKLLDEGSPGHGLPPGAYGKLKWNVVHVQDASSALAAHQYHRLLSATSYKTLKGDSLARFAITHIDVTYPEVRRMLLARGVKLFGGNGLDIVKDAGYGVWLPVQTEVAEWMGDTKTRGREALVSKEQIAEAVKRSRPGDIIIERRNWYLSNIGLPGFWPHAALYLGAPDELAAFLDDDPQVRAHYGGKLTAALAARYPKAWASYSSTDEAYHPMRVIEAVSEGVVFTTAEHSFEADYVAALRPATSKLEVALAIERAFGYLWRPYDFDFDFYTDSSLVCSELVYKSYEPRAAARGLQLPLESVVGRMTLSPNTIVRLFDERAGREDAQLKFAWFLDGHEASGRAVWADETALRTSWQRAKWDVAQQ
jgi:hypothetical protein